MSSDKEFVRNCGLTSFAYLLSKGDILESF